VPLRPPRAPATHSNCLLSDGPAILRRPAWTAVFLSLRASSLGRNPLDRSHHRQDEPHADAAHSTPAPIDQFILIAEGNARPLVFQQFERLHDAAFQGSRRGTSEIGWPVPCRFQRIGSGPLEQLPGSTSGARPEHASFGRRRIFDRQEGGRIVLGFGCWSMRQSKGRVSCTRKFFSPMTAQSRERRRVAGGCEKSRNSATLKYSCWQWWSFRRGPEPWRAVSHSRSPEQVEIFKNILSEGVERLKAMGFSPTGAAGAWAEPGREIAGVAEEIGAKPGRHRPSARWTAGSMVVQLGRDLSGQESALQQSWSHRPRSATKNLPGC